MKKGKLNLNEKYIIKGMLGDGHSPEEIATSLDRGVRSVKNYIDRELDQVASHVVQAKLEADVAENETVSRRVYKQAVSQLENAGLTSVDAKRVANAAVNAARAAEMTFEDSAQLFQACVRRMKAGQFMNKKTQGGKEGVAMMTAAASQRSDEHVKQNAGRVVSRSARGAIYRPDTGEIE